VAWYEKNSGGMVHPVKQKRPNELGFYDMSGNVWEWCSDFYGDYERNDDDEEEVVYNPKGPARGSQHVVRGASYKYYSQSCRVSCRLPLEATGESYNSTGFRLAMNVVDNLNGDEKVGTETAGQLNSDAHANGNPVAGKADRSSGKSGKSRNGNYWGSTGGGKRRKKKVWPWIVAPVAGLFLFFLLIILIVLLSGGEEPANSPIVDEPPVSNVPATEVSPPQKPSKKMADVAMMNRRITRLGKEIEAAKATGKPLYNYATDYEEGIRILDSIKYYSNQVTQNKDSYNDDDFNRVIGRIDSLRTKTIEYVDAMIKTQTENKEKSTIASVKSNSEHAIKQLQDWKMRQQ
jgi:hypothetical protein